MTNGANYRRVHIFRGARVCSARILPSCQQAQRRNGVTEDNPIRTRRCGDDGQIVKAPRHAFQPCRRQYEAYWAQHPSPSSNGWQLELR